MHLQEIVATKSQTKCCHLYEHICFCNKRLQRRHSRIRYVLRTVRTSPMERPRKPSSSSPSINVLGCGHRKTFTTKGRTSDCLLVLCTNLNVHITKLAHDTSLPPLQFTRENKHAVLFVSHSSILKFWHQVQRLTRGKNEGPRGAPKKAIKFIFGARPPWLIPNYPVGKMALKELGVDTEGPNNYNRVLKKSIRMVGQWLSRLLIVLSHHGRFNLLGVLFQPSRATRVPASPALHDSHRYGQYFASANNIGIIIRETGRVLDAWNFPPCIFVEPSCGDGRILHAAIKAFDQKSPARHAFVGIDLDAACITRCRTRTRTPTQNLTEAKPYL